MRSEHHLFIVWANARTHEEQILKSIENDFHIVKTFEVHWSKKKFSENLSRFYGTNLPEGSSKQEHCGTGPFLLIITRDDSPEYGIQETSRGDERVNTRTFLSKQKFRELTGGGHKIHGTNSSKEFRHDIMLLTGLSEVDFYKKYKDETDPLEPEKIYQDIVGSKGWESVEQLFYVMKETISFVVLRNFEPLPHEYYSDAHGDIDILVDSYKNAKYIMNAIEVFPEDYRVHNKVTVDGKEVLFDIRFVGDGYYDKVWQRSMLKSKESHNNIPVLSPEEYFYSLLYHVLIHKEHIADDYAPRLDIINKSITSKSRTSSLVTKKWIQSKGIEKLGLYIAARGYSITIPEPSVRFNHINAEKIQTETVKDWLKEKYQFDFIKQLDKSLSNSERRFFKASKGKELFFIKSDKHDLTNEYNIAKLMYEKNKNFFVEPIDVHIAKVSYLVMRWSDGVRLDRYLKRYKITNQQKSDLINNLYKISELLYDDGIVHRDLIPRNFLVSADKLVLIDFHYAVRHDKYQELDYVEDDILSVGLLGESFAAGVYKWDDASSFVKLANYILGNVDSSDHSVIKKMAEKIGKRVITPEGSLLDSVIKKQQESIETQKLVIGQLQKQIIDKDGLIARQVQQTNDLRESRSYAIGRKVTLPYRILKSLSGKLRHHP